MINVRKCDDSAFNCLVMEEIVPLPLPEPPPEIIEAGYYHIVAVDKYGRVIAGINPPIIPEIEAIPGTYGTVTIDKYGRVLTGTNPATIPNVSVVPGNYHVVTVDEYGRVIAGSNPPTIPNIFVTPGTYNLVSIDQYGRVISASNQSYNLEVIGTPGTYNTVTTDSFGRVVSGSNVELEEVGTAGTYNSIITDKYGRVISGTNNAIFSLEEIGNPGTYDFVTTDLFGRVISGSNRPVFPSRNFWYFSRNVNHPINANTFIITSNTIDIGDPNIFHLVNPSKPISAVAKATYEKNKNDIIYWKYNFIPQTIGYDWGYGSYSIPNNPNLTHNDYINNTFSFWSGGFFEITLNENYKPLLDGQSISVYLDNILQGIITNTDQTVELFIAWNNYSLYVEPSSQDIYDIQFITQSPYAHQLIIDSITKIYDFSDTPFNNDIAVWKMKIFDDALPSPEDHIDIYLNNNLIGSLSNSNNEVLIYPGLTNTNDIIRFQLVISNYDPLNTYDIFAIKYQIYADGSLPEIDRIDDNFIIYYSSYSGDLKPGVMTVESQLYDENLNLKATNPPIYFIIEDLNEPNGC